MRATVCEKCLVKMERALNLCVEEDTNRKWVVIDGNVLLQEL